MPGPQTQLSQATLVRRWHDIRALFAELLRVHLAPICDLRWVSDPPKHVDSECVMEDPHGRPVRLQYVLPRARHATLHDDGGAYGAWERVATRAGTVLLGDQETATALGADPRTLQDGNPARRWAGLVHEVTDSRPEEVGADYTRVDDLAMASIEAVDRILDLHQVAPPRPEAYGQLGGRVPWGGAWISHAEAAEILGIPSRQTGRILSGSALRKAIARAPEGDPLSLLRDAKDRKAKSRSGRLRQAAVEHVARMRASDSHERLDSTGNAALLLARASHRGESRVIADRTRTERGQNRE